MTKPVDRPDQRTPAPDQGDSAPSDPREARLAAALRANLRRRKAAPKSRD
jgi:hypothetical protein